MEARITDNNKSNAERRPSAPDLLFLYSAFMPWVSFRTNDLDSQPWPIILAILAILLGWRIYKSLYIVAVFIVISFAILITLLTSIQNPHASDFLVLRSIFGYIGLLVFFVASYNIRRLNISISKHLNIISYIWFMAAVIQATLGRYSLGFLVVARTSDTRGVTSLAPEPTFYGMLVLTLTWVILLEAEKDKIKMPFLTKLAVFLNLTSIIFLSKSSMSLLYVAILGVGLILYVLKPSPRIIFSIILSFILIAISIPFVLNFLDGSRMLHIVEILIASPLFLLEYDMSVNQRFSHIYFSMSGLLDGFGLPRGVGSFSDYASSIKSSFWGVQLSLPGEKIMSWVGVFIFELGVIGVFVICVFLTAVYRGSEGYFRIIPSFCFILVGLSALPLGFAPLCVLVGLYAAKSDAKYRKRYN